MVRMAQLDLHDVGGPRRHSRPVRKASRRHHESEIASGWHNEFRAEVKAMRAIATAWRHGNYSTLAEDAAEIEEFNHRRELYGFGE